MRIGKIENDFMDVKIEVRKLIDTVTPEKNDELDLLLSKIDNLLKSAVSKKIKEDEELEKANKNNVK